MRFARTRSQRGSWSVQEVSQLNLPPSEHNRLRPGVKVVGEGVKASVLESTMLEPPKSWHSWAFGERSRRATRSE
jgi:hypothetical protein